MVRSLKASELESIMVEIFDADLPSVGAEHHWKNPTAKNRINSTIDVNRLIR